MDCGVDFHLEKGVWTNKRFIPKGKDDLHLEEFSRNGYTVLENCSNEESVTYSRKRIDEIYAMQVEEIGGEENLRTIGDQGLARMLLAYDDHFVDLVFKEEVISLAKKILGNYFVLFQQNGNLNKPNESACSTPWHRDFNFREYVSSKPLGITVLHVIDDFTEENDGIYILPGSQKHEIFPSFEYVKKNEQKLYAKAGTIVVFDSMWFHRSGFNKSKGNRRIVQHMYTLPFLGQQISIPRLLQGRFSDDPFRRWVLGYNNMTHQSILDWREGKLISKRNLKASMVEAP